MTNLRREQILSNFTFGDLENEITLSSIKEKLEQIDADRSL